ncbi:chemotaxis protein CheW [Anatilimnocola sp. NA78]|uniref:hybrid sensor histidine kinase/response regulator n=1 Tax=Anatilimnocola sp. NA78 TaxID=3415683 RepID=UPI003CE47B75
MFFEDKAILDSFVVESKEHLSDVETLLLSMEAGGSNIDAEAVNSVFRAIHSIKGGAGFLGLTKVNDLAHALENVLNQMRVRELAPNNEIIDLLLRSADLLRTLIDAIGCDRQDKHDSYDIRSFVTALDYLHTHGVCQNGKPTAAAAASQSPPVATRTATATAVNVQAASASPPPQPTEVVAPAAEAHAADANIRVAVEVLDKLMNLAGELVLSRNQLLQAVGTENHAGLEATAARVDQVTSELQEAIMQTRMQPLAQVFNRFPRVVRDLSAKLGKQIDLQIHGKEVEVDKTIIEAIGDPLIHLVRNSLDHGIETPDVRTRRGKKATGTISLEASHQAGRVNIVVRDDGAGIDAARLRTKAVSKGILTAEQAAALSDRDAIELIFHPGFSTAEQVTDVSGRGVGMDVVKSNISRLGGTVEIVTRLDRGTEVHVKLPLTLAIIPSLVVRGGSQRFAISQASIHELVRVKATELLSRVSIIQGAEVLKLRGKLLPLVRLGAALGQVSATAEGAARGLDIIVVETGSIRYGLVVDGLHDSEEIVVKPMGQHLKGCTCLAGATILGDGQVALILDVAGVAAQMKLSKSAEDESADEQQNTASVEKQATLLFTNHPTETFGIPMAVIRRLERVRADQIDVIGGRSMLEYDNASLPLIALEDHLNAKPRPQQTWVYVVIFDFNEREVAVMVPNLNEIRELPTNFDTRTFREPGVIGSVVVDKRAIRLIDVFELAAAAYPQLSKSGTATPKTKEPARATRILLAEDSAFFRSQVIAFLESKGYEVVGAEDGLDAWNLLQIEDEPFDLVLTDIEMPNMNGFEFSERIRQSEEFGHLPIVALTSLAGEEDVRRGREAGITDYQVKMDRDRLLASVARLLKETRRPKPARALV